jgi:hypothetical protein
LGAIADKAAQQTIKQLQDRVGELEALVKGLADTVLRTGSPVNAYGQRIYNLGTPQAAQDAVTLAFMKRYVQVLVNSSVVPPSAPVPGVPGDPNTLPSDALPLYDGSAIVAGVFAAHPDFVARSCQAQAGTWELMDAIVDALRAADTRFAYNGKRGNANDPSNDAISYDYGVVAGGEGSTKVYVVDVIAGHCGVNPQPGWNDVTVFAPGVWISRGRF